MEKILVKLDYHTAVNTNAKTWWTTEDGRKPEDVFPRVFSTKARGKTHWVEYYLAPPDITLIQHRISNRGNYSVSYFKATQLEADPEEIPPEARPR